MTEETYKTPIAQLIRQIVMLLLSILILVMSGLMNILTNRINTNLESVQKEINNSTFYKVVN